MRTMAVIYDDAVRMGPSDLIGWDNRGTKEVRLGQRVVGEPVYDYYNIFQTLKFEIVNGHFSNVIFLLVPQDWESILW